MYGGHVFPCQSYIWSTTVLHNEEYKTVVSNQNQNLALVLQKR